MTPPPGFDMRVSGAGASVVVHLCGELDLGTAPRLRERLAGLISDGARHVTLDLEALDFIDSSGLNVLVSALKRLREHGGDLAVRAPNASARKVFEITGLATVLTFVDGVEEPARARSDAASA